MRPRSSSGSTTWQEITKVQLPMAKGSLVLATNQGLLYVLAMVVIGGLGSVSGSALAAVIIGLTQQFGNYYTSWLGDFVIVLLLAVVLLVRPRGLMGELR